MSAQPGPQTDFLSNSADICIYGGAAGGGKTVGLILEPLRYVRRVANFTAVFFRRTTPQITNPEGAGSGGSAGGVERLPAPGQEFGNAPRRMIGDTGEHVGEIVLRVEAVELGALDQ